MTKALDLPPAGGAHIQDAEGRIPGFAGVFHRPPKPLRDTGSKQAMVEDLPAESNVARLPQSPSSLPEGAVMIGVDLIDPSPYQPRLNITEESVEELAENIGEVGEIYVPIRVRPKADGRYELIAGERRLRSVKLLRWPEIAAVVKHVSDAQAKLETYVENLGRKDLSSFETALIISDMLETGMAKNQREVARKTALSNGSISTYMAYFKLPEQVLAMLRKNPELVSLRDAPVLAKHVEAGHDALVVEAVKLVGEGKINSSGISRWIHEKLTGRVREKTRREVFATRMGREICTVTHSGQGSIMIALASQEESDKVADAIKAALADLAARCSENVDNG